MGSLFTRHGVTIVGNDVIVSVTMSILSVSMLAAISGIPWLSESVWSHELPALQEDIVDFFEYFGFMFVAATVLEVIRSAAKAIQVVFLEVRSGSAVGLVVP